MAIRPSQREVCWFFRREPDGTESAFGVELAHRPDRSDLQEFRDSLGGIFEYLPEHVVTDRSAFEGRDVAIIGPRLTFETPDSSGATEIARRIGFPEVSRIEQFRIYPAPAGTGEWSVDSLPRDRVMELIYPTLPTSFRDWQEPPQVQVIPLLTEGQPALDRFLAENNLGFRPEQVDLIEETCVAAGRNPTDVLLYALANAWSDHCRHLLFMLTRFIIDGREKPESLLDMLKAPYAAIRGTPADNTEIVLADNASAVTGFPIRLLVPSHPGWLSEYVWATRLLHVLFSGETHNYPGQVAPNPGAATEIGGEIRDQLGAGCGSEVTHSVCARVVGSLRFPNGYRIPGEFVGGRRYDYPPNKAEPIEVIREGIKGWVDYANAFGVPCVDLVAASGAVWRPRRRNGRIVRERLESLKPVCAGFGVGVVDDVHKKKARPRKGWLVVRIGGGAYPIGFCGGSGSSSVTGTNTAEFDEKAIQRGNPEMERRFYQVLLACNAMGRRSPIKVIHDQGAGGLANMSSELIGKAGGRIYLGAVTVNDPTMGDLKVYVCEWQESQGVLIKPGRYEEFKAICERERCPCDLIGEITGDGAIEVYHEASAAEVERQAASPIVEIATCDLFGKVGRFQIEDITPEIVRLPIVIPPRMTFEQALLRTLRRSEVASTEWFFRLVDGSVGAKVVKGPFCGPWATPVPGSSIIALSNFSESGQATAIGMDPFATCLDVEAGARLSIGRLYTKLLGAGIESPDLIKVLCNWMWPANIKPPDGEVALLYRAVEAVRKVLLELGTAIIGGKDSSSMATWVEGALVKSLETIIFSASVPVRDVSVHLTPDVKWPGESHLVHIDLADRQRRLGGSSFGLSLGQLGDFAPDLEYPRVLRRAFTDVYELTKNGEAISGCHIDKGGLAATVLRMCFAGGSGVWMRTRGSHTPYAELLADELGYVIEVPNEALPNVRLRLCHSGLYHQDLGPTIPEPRVVMTHNDKPVLDADLWDLRREWERTSHELWRLIVSPKAAGQERRATRVRQRPVYRATFSPTAPRATRRKPWALVVREQGSNGHPECAEALKRVGFRVADAHMSDFPVDLGPYQLILWAPGFSYKDILGAAVGWALSITRNPVVRESIESFMERDDTLSWGICNGAQLGLRCGWVMDDLPPKQRPLFTQIGLGRFNHQWVRVRVQPSPSVFLQGMEGSILGTYVANGEGYCNCTRDTRKQILRRHLDPLVYVDAVGRRANTLPHSPSGSDLAALCDDSGRHLYTMPHMFDRGSLMNRWAYAPPEFWPHDESPWFQMGVNAFNWCVEHR